MFKVVHGDWKGFGIHETDTAASIDLTAGATTFTAFVNHFDSDLGGADHYGLGVSHDLGGGASLVAGVVDSRYEGEVIWDAGISMDF